MFNFRSDFIDVLDDYGVYDIVIPFLLVFTIVFAFLQKTAILGKDKAGKPHSKYNMIVALVMAIVSIRIPLVVQIFQNALPKVGITVIAILMVFILVSMFTGKDGLGIPMGGWMRSVILIAPALAVAYYFLSEIYPYFPYLYFISDNIQTIIIIAVFAMLIFFITSDEDAKTKDKKKEEAKKYYEQLFKL